MLLVVSPGVVKSYNATPVRRIPSSSWIIHIICTYFCTDQDAPDIIAEDLRPSQPRSSSESQKAFDVFRPPGYQKSVQSGDSHQRLLSEVHEGILVGDQPLPMNSDHTVDPDEDTEKDIAKQMWLEAVDDLKKDNRRQQRQLQQEQDQEKEANFDMSDVFCLFPCCCCCFCICRKPRKKGIRKK